MKDKVYADAPQSIQELNEKIRTVIDEIEPQICENVMENFIKRAWSCKRSRGGHISMLLFLIINGKASAFEWNKNQMIFHKNAFFL